MNPSTTNNNKKYLVGIVVAILVLLAGIAILARNKPSTSTQTPTQQTQVAPLPTEAKVSLSSNGFEPKTVTIKVGSAVRWMNDSGKSATVNSDDHPTHKKFPEMNLGEFANGQTLVHIFNKAGTYTYHNHYNPGQTGTVVVE